MTGEPAEAPPTAVGGEPALEHFGRRALLDVGAVSTLSALGVLCWIELYRKLNDWIWNGSYVSSHRWTFPALALAFSLVVGLAVRYLKAPTCMSGSMVDAFKGTGEQPRWRLLPATVVNSLASLLSGAAVGPEAPIGTLSMQIADGYNRVLRRSGPQALSNVLAGAAAAFNGLIENPIFTSVLASDLEGDRRSLARNLPANLLAGTIGYLIFLAVGTKGFAGYLGLPQPGNLHWAYLVYDIGFALIGIVLAVLLGLVLRIAASVFDRFVDRVILRALIGGAIAASFGYFIPVAAFSGESQIFTLIGDPTHYSKIELIGLALLKLCLLAVAFMTGFLGGPTFPSIFAATAVGLAISSAFPHIPLVVILAGIIGAQLTVLFKAPFMVILFVSFFLSANTNVLALVIVSVAVAMIVMPYIQDAMARRQAPRAGPGRATTS